MKAFKRTMALVLTLVTLFSMIPVRAFATEPQVAPEMDTGDMTIEGTNGFGTLLSQEIQESQEESASADESYEAGYSIADLTFDGAVATVEYSSLEEARLVVAVYSEDGLKMLANGETVVDPEENEATVTIEGDMPEFFLASAYLLDTYDMSPLCSAYDTPMYTREMQELLASTVDDYDPKLVLNLDKDETTNFAVYNENAEVIDYEEGVNIVASVDDENATYVIENVDERITSLAAGDILVYEYGENEMLIAKIGTIKLDGTTATINGDDLEIEEVFSHVKVTGTGDSSNLVIDESTATDGVVYQGNSGARQTYADARNTDNGTASASLKIEFDAIKIGNDNLNTKLTGGVALELSISVEYYVTSSYQLFETKVDVSFNGNASFSGEAQGSISLGKYFFPIIPVVLTAGFDPNIVFEAEAAIEVEFGLDLTIGATIDHGKQGWNQSGYCDSNTGIEAKVEGKFFVGLELEPKVELLQGLLADFKLSAKGGGEASLGQDLSLDTSGCEIHECIVCYAGELKFKFSLVASAKFLKKEKLSVKATLVELESKVGDFYWSRSFDEFGLGYCPHLSYRLTATVVDRYEKPVKDAVVTAGDNSATTNKKGIAELYLPVAEYEIAVTHEDITRHHNLYMNSAQKIKVTMVPDGTSRPVLEFIIPDDCIDDTITVIHGKCGEDVFWTLNNDGILNISGTGPMWNYYDDISEIPWYSHCSSITEVIIGDDVTTIGDYAFYICENLRRVSIGGLVTTIGDHAFNSCTSLTSVTIPNSVTTIGESAFSGCTSLTSVTIPNGVTTIGDHTFSSCTSLTNVTIPNSVTTIGNYAFNSCTSLTSVTIPNGVTTIGDWAFCDCINLASVIIPDSVTSIGDGAFHSCTGLRNMTIGDSVTSIGDSAFFKCSRLVSVMIPDNVTTIGNGVFAHCTSLKNVEISNSVTSIGGATFINCASLTSVTIPNNVTTIGESAFNQCTSLTSVEIPDSVTTIGGTAFANCSSMMEIVFRGDAPKKYGPQVFYANHATIYYPAGSVTWTSSVKNGLSDSAFHINWVPYTLDENGGMIINETAAAVTVDAELVEIGVLNVPSEEAATQTGLEEVSTLSFSNQEENLSPAAAYGGEYSNIVTDIYTLKTALFSGLVPGKQYVLLAMVNIDVEDPLAADNLLYIDQAAALEDGTLVFQYIQRVATETSYVVACGASNKDLNEAEITFPEMVTDGETQTVNPTVVYDGKTLTEGQDYTILGTVSFTEPGTYTCYIRGVRNYTGLVECIYKVSRPIDAIASGTCGLNLTWSFYDDGMLTISGTGPMTEFSSYTSVPWYDKSSSIVTVIIDYGVTTIGAYAFYDCANLTSVSIGDSVSNIGDRAFKYCGSLNSVEIPDSVTTIGYEAFQFCASLTSVEIPDSVTFISAYAFYDCTSLTNVSIGASVTAIGLYVFNYCTSLSEIYVNENNPNYSSDDRGVLFDKEKVELIKAPSAISGSYEIPNSVATIDDYAFHGCGSLISVEIPDSVTTIGDHAFHDCGSLISVEIPNSVTTIDDYAFCGCSSLISVEIPNSVTTIARYTFRDCTNLTSVEIPDSVITIGYGAFEFCASLTSMEIPNSVTTIGGYVFHDCANLNQITFRGDAPAIDSGVFSRVIAVVYYPANKSTWNEAVFQNYGGTITWEAFECTDHSYKAVMTDPTCTKQGYITYTCSKCGDSYVSDETEALGHGYKAVTVDPTCTEQGYTTYTCSECGDSYVSDETEALGHTYESDINENGEMTYTCIACGESYTEAILDTLQYVIAEDHVRITDYTGSAPELAIPAEIEGLPVTVIGEKAFYDCDNLISITVPDSVTIIGDMAFSDCYSLTSVTIPEGVTTIGDSAFSWCDSLTSVTIPEGVTTISDSTFSGCDNLVSVTIPEGVTTIGDSAFYWCDSLTNVTIPDSVTSIGNDAFYLCNSLTSMTIPDGMITIGDYAFWSCTSLNDVTLSGSVASIGTKAFGACTSLRKIKFMGDVPAIGEEVFYNIIATAYYPANNPTWTEDVFQNYGGEITWCIDIEELGDLLGLEIVSAPAGGFVGKKPDLSGLRVELICSDDLRFTADNAQLTISEIDTSTVGKKTVIVSYGGVFDEFTYLVHEGSRIVLDSSLYPESTHDYENDMDETQTLTWPGATGLVLVFSEETYVEGTYDRIYVYDGTDSLIASYSGSKAAGVTLEVPGDTVKIRLTSDYSTTYYGYSFTSISTADTVVHTGTDIIPAVEATCTEPGRTEVIVCEVCDQEQYTVIPALGHDYESVVTSSESGVYSYTTHTCTRCGDSYIDNVTVPGSIVNGTCGDTLFWAVTETGILHIFGEGEMDNYYYFDAHPPWYRYENMFQYAVIHEGVTTIGVYAFYNHTRLISVEIQNSVTTIGEQAFYLCEGMTSVEIPDSVTSIGDLAFYQCTSLTSLEIPNSVITIGNRSFWGCKNLESIYVDDNNLYFSSDSNGILFNKQKTTLIHAPQAISGAYTIPDGVIEIGSYAFAESNSLTSVKIPTSVNKIGDRAFYLCSSLKGIYVDENNSNFSNDSYGVLFDKQQTLLVKAPTTISGAYVIPASVTAIGDDAFYSCRSLNSIDIPSNVATIGNYAFYMCRSLTSINIRVGVTTIGDYAFGYTSLTSVEIPEGVTTIGQNAFTYCLSLESVSIPGSVTTFGDFAFQNCEALTSVEILDGVTKIGRYAFSHCVSLKSVSIPASVTIIDESAFSSCEALARVELSECVTQIGSYSFARCFNLVSVKIPASVTTINNGAFTWCTGLREITFCGKAPEFDNYLFGNVTAKVYYPATDSTWTVEVMQNYGGTLTWEAYTPECTDHTYETVVTAPTCIEQGYTTYTCSVCGQSYVDAHVDVLGHNYVAGACTRCGEKDPNATVIAITSQPTDYVGLVGDTVTFTVVAEGEDLKYQWQYAEPGSDEWANCFLAGYNTNTLTVKAASHRMGMQFRCVVTNATGVSVTSEAAKISQATASGDTAPEILTQPVSQSVELDTMVSFTVKTNEGAFTYQWQYAEPGSEEWANCFLTGYNTNTLTVKAASHRMGMQFRCVVTNAAGKTATSEAAKISQATASGDTAPEIHTQPISQSVELDSMVSFTVETNAGNYTYQWQYTEPGSNEWVNCFLTGYNTNTLTVKAAPHRMGMQFRCVVTNATGVSVTSEAAKISQATTPDEAVPEILSQPVSQSVELDTMVSFTVETNEGNYTYQWQYAEPGSDKWANCFLTGYNTNTLTVKAASHRMGMQFRCVVTNATGVSVTSEAAKISPAMTPDETVPEILTQPASQSVEVDTMVSFTVETNEGNYTYQWQYADPGSNEWAKCMLSGYNTDTLTVKAASHRIGMKFRCVVTSKTGETVTSEAAMISLAEAPKDNTPEILTHPLSQSVELDSMVSFTVKANEGAYTYQWEYSDPGSNAWAKCMLSGYNTDTLTVKATSYRIGMKFRCVVTSKTGESVTSEAAMISLAEEPKDTTPEIVTQPLSQKVELDSMVSFTVKTNGGDYTYQWQYADSGSEEWANCYLSGYNTNTMTVKAAVHRIGMKFRCVVISEAGESVISEAAMISLAEAPKDNIPEIMTQPVSQRVELDSMVSFTIKTNEGDYTYQWEYANPGSNEWAKCMLSGHATDTLTVKAVVYRNGMKFRCIVTGNRSSVTSEEVVLSLK